MATATTRPANEMEILRRVVNRKHSALSDAAARAILHLDFDNTDRKRMNRLAAKNRAGRLTSAEEEELENFIYVGQLLGILKSKARKSLKSNKT